jgi:hypothetical protein
VSFPRLGILFFSVFLLSSCARDALPSRTAPRSNLRALGVGGPIDPTVIGARMVPETVDDDRTYGVEPGGGVRAIASGIRVVSMPDGAVLATEDKLPQLPGQTVALPDRLGGGFLYVLGSTIWRSDKWLSEAKPIYAHPSSISTVLPGLDRVYVRSQLGGYQAIDARSGQRMDLGPWPNGPTVSGYSAIDGWRAAAIVDLRGTVVTSDAGATWRAVPLPIQPQSLMPIGDSVVVTGREATGAIAWFEVRADGQAGRLSSLPKLAAPQTGSVSTAPPDAKPFGRRPLVAAIEDGWPLTDGTAVVARDGAIARVRLRDGALLEVAGDAFSLKPSRCHGVSLNRPSAVGAFGFVCGEPRGATVLYAYDPNRGVLQEIKRFDRPRLVVTSGNGALAIRGGCADDATLEDKDGQHTYCLLPLDSRWREIHVRGEVGDERLVVLSDGRVAIVSPPRGDLATARLTVLDKGKASTVPIVFEAPPPDVARALRLGTWMEGFEERRPGVVGGWVEAGGAVVGVEVGLDGAARFGQFIRDATPVVSGRYGLGWSTSHRGYETTDGGMTWLPIEVPEAATSARGTGRACGPIGCTAGGWLRVGWGQSKKGSFKETPPIASGPSHRGNSIDLACEPVAAAPPPVPTGASRGAAASPGVQQRVRTLHAPRPAYPTPSGGVTASQEMQPFYSVPAPALRADERGLSNENTDGYIRGGLARMYAWGPKSGDWDRSAHWLVRWTSPFAGSQDVSSSQVSPPPQLVLDMSRTTTSYGSYYNHNATWTFVAGDTPKHGLLSARRYSVRELSVFALEAERAPLELKRADGEPFTTVEAAVRAGDHWFLASSPEGEVPATILWQVDGATAREVARVPRTQIDGRTVASITTHTYPYSSPAHAQSSGAHLARRSDGRAIGLVVDGQASGDRAVPLRWVLPIDIESGATLEPESLGPTDLADRTIGVCAGDEVGWILDVPPGSTSIRIVVPGGRGPVPLTQAFARMRISKQSACIERLGGSAESLAGDTTVLTRGRAVPGPKMDGPSIPVAAFVARARYPLRCTKRTP